MKFSHSKYCTGSKHLLCNYDVIAPQLSPYPCGQRPVSSAYWYCFTIYKMQRLRAVLSFYTFNKLPVNQMASVYSHKHFLRQQILKPMQHFGGKQFISIRKINSAVIAGSFYPYNLVGRHRKVFSYTGYG